MIFRSAIASSGKMPKTFISFACIRCVAIVLGVFLMINPAVQAQNKQITKMPRPSIDGTWRIVAIDQRQLKRPINNFRAEHFEGNYLPIGTTFTLKIDGLWGTREPTRMDLLFKVHPPIPKEVCPEKPFDDPMKNVFYHPLCYRDGRPVDIEFKEDWEFMAGYIELQHIKHFATLDKYMAAYLTELGYKPNDVYFQYGDNGTLGIVNFIPYGKDVLIITNSYMEYYSLDVNDTKQNYGNVLLVAKRVK